jgi:hypothetical protein
MFVTIVAREISSFLKKMTRQSGSFSTKRIIGALSLENDLRLQAALQIIGRALAYAVLLVDVGYVSLEFQGVLVEVVGDRPLSFGLQVQRLVAIRIHV